MAHFELIVNTKSQQSVVYSHRLATVNYDFAKFTASQVTPRELKVEMVQYNPPVLLDL